VSKKVTAFLNEFARWVRYLYFLRFSILLWWFPLLLCWANGPNNARSLVSGIITPSRLIQYLCAAFFLVAASFVALILARIVVINGGVRFGDEGPRLLLWLLANDNREYEWVAPVAFQINTLIVFLYFLINGQKEGVSLAEIAKGFAGGVGLAVVFWLAVNALYYMTYQPAPPASEVARTLMFPRSWLFLSKDGKSDSFGDVLERSRQPVPFQKLAWFFPVEGYRWPPRGGLYEGHYFSILAAGAVLALYLVLWPLTAPVLVPSFYAWLAVILYLLGGLAVIVLVFLAKPGRPRDAQKLRAWKAILAAAVVMFAATIPSFYRFADAERFPILALLLILVMGVVWGLGAVAFFADRFRIPVLTVLIFVMVVPRMMHLDYGREAHYLSTSLREEKVKLPTPADILNSRLDKDETQPLIVVTSTGGGIHAAAWTTAILAQLETLFSTDTSLKSFHDHVLLLSTVSGGSSGLYAYLRELDSAAEPGPDSWKRMKSVARCSSLEAAGWGLIYYDLPKAFVPGLPILVPPSTGVDDLDKLPLGKDRTWSLRKAFARNLNDPYCRLDPNDPTLTPLSKVYSAEQGNRNNEQGLTLGNLGQTERDVPAFTMNTTTVEGGERFLLANYQVLPHTPDPLKPQPAESFLQTFGGQQFSRDGKSLFTDLPLATSAQLSATFPLVSSAAGFPAVGGMKSAHFVDGGYYDNDGTASAIEFLSAALDGLSAKHANAKVKILLIEIRNSGASVRVSESSDAWQGNPKDETKPWNLVDQVMAPLEAFYSAGHESVTARNRNGLQLLIGAYPEKLDLEHIVIEDLHDTPDNEKTCTGEDNKTDPLNWSLTPAQQCEVDQSVNQKSNRQKYLDALNWFHTKAGHQGPPQQK
jgi:hypothetical protein